MSWRRAHQKHACPAHAVQQLAFTQDSEQNVRGTPASQPLVAAFTTFTGCLLQRCVPVLIILPTQVMSASALAGTEMALLSAGVKIEPGSGVGAAVKYWADSSSVIPTRTPAT
jgi:hypothetical protein